MGNDPRLGVQLAQGQQDVTAIRDDTQWLENEQAEALDQLGALETSVNDALHTADAARRAADR